MSESISETQREFLSHCETHQGPVDGPLPLAKLIEEMYMSGNQIMVVLDDYDNDMFGVSFDYLIRGTCSLIEKSHPNDASEIRAETLEALRAAIIAVEQQECRMLA